MNQSIYSPFKIARHLERLNAFQQGENPGPLTIHLVLTNRCNQACQFCAYRTPGYPSNELYNPKEQIPIDRYQELCDSLVRLTVRGVELTGGGEPTCHPGFSEFCRQLAKRGIAYAVVTNGLRLTSDPAIFQACLNAAWLRISIDAGTAETYARLRRTPMENFHVVWEGVSRLREARGNKTTPTIGVSFLVTRENYRELPQVISLTNLYGADYLRIGALFSPLGADYYRDFLVEFNSLRSEILKSSKVIDLFDQRYQDLLAGPPVQPSCWLQHFVTYLGADLHLYRCCNLAYTSLGYLGSARRKSLYELWHAEECQQRRREFDARRCTRCLFTAKNQFLDYLLAKETVHEAFV